MSGIFGVQRYAVSDGTEVNKIDTALAPAPVYLSALGISGLTAYFGLLDVGQPEPGQTVLVSGAAGSVGSIVGQIARIKGCRAVGVAGGEENAAGSSRKSGFDAAIDYKAADLRKELKTHAPDGDRRLLRQRRRGDIRGRTEPARPRCPHRAVRRGVAVQRHSARARQLHATARRTRIDDRIRHLRLRQAATRKVLRNWRNGSTAANCNHTSRSSTAGSQTSPTRCSSCSVAKTPAS